MKKILLSPYWAILTLLIVICIRIDDPYFVSSTRLKYFDTLITSKAPTENNVYTVNIDEAALDKNGQWPFKRDFYADTVETLYLHNAGLVVFNVLMSETDRLGGDDKLEQTLKVLPVVLPSVPASKTKNTPKNPGSVILNPEYQDKIVRYPGIISNIPVLENSSAGVGTTNTLPEIDGVNRRVPLVTSVDGKLYPALSLETLRVLAQDTTFQIKLNELGVEKLRIPSFGPVTTDSLGRIWIDWSQKNKSVSITDIPADFSGAVVIVGTSAAGISNPLSTPIGAVYPQDVQAAVISTMINGVVIERPDWVDMAEILAIFLGGIIVVVASRWTYAFAPVILTLGVSHFAASWVFQSYNMLIDITAFVVGISLVYGHAYTVKFLSEYLQKEQIKKQFGGYVSPVMVERLQKNPDLIKLGGERKILSSVMTDLRGFTTLGESYGDDVEGLTQIMNDYMTAISEPVLKNNGCIIKFIGDASLHIHGAPLDDADHAKVAVQTGLEMVQAVTEFNKQLVALGKPPVGMGVGVNSGPILVGNIGSKYRFGYDVLGDAVSLTSRLEGQTKGYGVLLILGETTAELVKDDFTLLELDTIQVKGKTIGIKIYTAFNTRIKINTEDVLLHSEMLSLYRKQKFDEASICCENLKGKFEGEMDQYYNMWIDRCKEMKTKNLPLDWTGIYILTSK
jgi:adenylate cyclase